MRHQQKLYLITFGLINSERRIINIHTWHWYLVNPYYEIAKYQNHLKIYLESGRRDQHTEWWQTKMIHIINIEILLVGQWIMFYFREFYNYVSIFWTGQGSNTNVFEYLTSNTNTVDSARVGLNGTSKIIRLSRYPILAKLFYIKPRCAWYLKRNSLKVNISIP